MKVFWCLMFLVLPAVLLSVANIVAYAEDSVDAEDKTIDEVEIESDVEDIGAGEELKEEIKPNGSPLAETTVLFVKPVSTGANLELPAGVPVEFLVGFRNKQPGENDKFIVQTLEASFRYPMDFNFYIQNFSTISYNKEIPTDMEATFSYSFVPADVFAGRPFGLVINLGYVDHFDKFYTEAVFNETVQIVELDEGLDGETIFLYIFLAAGVVLLLVIGQQTLLSVGKKRTSWTKTPVETGTSNPDNIDYEWLPKQTLAALNKEKLQKAQESPKSSKSPKAGKQQSPKQRKTKRSTGSE